MGYQLEIDPSHNLITLTYETHGTFQDRLHALEEIIGHLKENPTINVFVDGSRVENAMSTNEQIELGKLLGKNSAVFGQNKTAVLQRKGLHAMTIAKAYVGGHTHIVEFEDRGEAMDWLNGRFK